MNAVLEAVAGPDAGKVFRFTRGTVTIGRRAGEIPLTDPEVSRRHTVVEVFGRGMIYLRDLGSTNGTFHNGRRVAVGRIRAGDTIGVGRSVLKMHVKV
jgi:pSer/pThr/pTyr-binding forkhead associated (FHA) protein